MTRRVGFVRASEIAFTVEMHDADGLEQFRAIQSERELRMTLGTGDRWPDEVRRGRSIDVEMSLGGALYRLTGRVRFRRLNVAVIQGTMTLEG